MKNKQTEPSVSLPATTTVESKPDEALVLFGGVQRMLPKELEDMGLAGKITTREIPGVPPTWKPVNHGDFLLGRCVLKRDVSFTQGTPPETRIRTVTIFETAIPGGFRSVWLGADLKLKIGNEPEGKVFQIFYDGDKEIKGRPLPMKIYRVLEIIPVNIDIPDNVEQLESRKSPAVLWVERGHQSTGGFLD